MKMLVVYYSRTGMTKKVGQAIAAELNCDVDEIIDKKDRSGALGYMLGGRDALFCNRTEILFKNDPSDYDLAIIGTPVWASTIAPAIYTYLEDHNGKLKSVAFFVTYGGTGDKTTLDKLNYYTGKNPVASLSLKTKDIANDDFKNAISDFIRKIKK